MLFYFIFLFTIALLSGRYNIAGYSTIKPHFGYYIACLIVIFTAIFRFDMGWDYKTYYLVADPDYKYFVVYNFGLSGVIIYDIANYFNNPLLVFVIYGLITYILIFKVIDENSSSKYESLIIYVAVFYLTSWSIMRQCAAGAVLFLGYKYIKNKNIIKYIVICMIASFIHSASVVGILLYPIYHMRYFYVIVFGLIIALSINFVLPIVISMLGLPYMSYLTKASEGSTLTRFFNLLLLFYCLALALYSKNFNNNRGLLSIITLGTLFPFILKSHLGARIGEYFLIYFVLLIPSLNQKLNINKRSIITMILNIYFILMLLATVHLSKSKNYVPYRFYFTTDRNEIFNPRFLEAMDL